LKFGNYDIVIITSRDFLIFQNNKIIL